MRAFDGDTVASALLANGWRTVSRSFKSHERRGILTADASDPHCNVSINGLANMRGAHVRLEEGMAVTSQGAWPSAAHDVKALNRLLHTFLAPGFYYKTFMAPRPLLPLYRSVLRRFSAGGEALSAGEPHGREKGYFFADVVVAGGGPAGMSAAIGAARVGARVLLVEQEYELGGHLRWGNSADLELLAELLRDVEAEPGIEVFCNSAVFGCYESNWIGIHQKGATFASPARLWRGRPRAFVLAAGLMERPAVFEGNGIPGVLLPSAVRRLLNLHAVRPGDRAVVAGTGDECAMAARDLEDVGVEVIVVDKDRGATVVKARGGRHVEEVHLSDGRLLEADVLVTAAGWTVPAALASMVGGTVRLSTETSRFVLDDLPDRFFLAGGIVVEGNADELAEQGRSVGTVAGHSAVDGLGGAGGSRPIPELAPGSDGLLVAPTRGIVDFDEEVTVGDLRTAVDEGYQSIELVKRYTTATMGITQGRHSLVSAISVVADASGATADVVGATTWRPPFVPVPLKTLAGVPRHPIRRTPMHSWHESHGATMFVEGEWLRPDTYGDAAAEAMAVRERVGLIDVTTLGKIDVRGCDARRLLDYLYVSAWSSLDVGRARYGVMCDDAGIVVEDGVVGRLEDERFVLTTTSSGAQRTWRRIERIVQERFSGASLFAAMVTEHFASMNVTGPRAREVLTAVIENCDLDPGAFPFMHVRTARVAGVDGCFLWRIGFTGEVSYELHVPANNGLHVWQALLESGQRFGIQTFGVEAQRILRVEKGHFVVGQDTEPDTTPYVLGLGRMVGRDKGPFVGQLALEHERDRQPLRRLVGLQFSSLVPESTLLFSAEGAIGRVTSSKWSPTLGCCVALGLLACTVADAGSPVSARLGNGSRLAATIVPGVCHVDPEGARARG